MKSFSSFIQEAVVSRAVEKAKRMGLVSDGHGNWYDRQGQYKGRTYKGDLILSKGKGPGKEDPEPSKNVPLNQRMENKKQQLHPNQEVVLLVEKNPKIQRKERERLLLLHLEGSTLLPLDMRNCWTPQSVKPRVGITRYIHRVQKILRRILFLLTKRFRT